MRFVVTAPVAGFAGEVAGVAFIDGRGEVDDGANPRAVAYFRRKGYEVAPVAPPAPAKPAKPAEPAKRDQEKSDKDKPGKSKPGV